RDEYGLVPRLWGSLSQIKGKTSITSSGVTMNIWNNNWADANSMISEGYNIINSIDSDLYIVPLAGYYRDYLDIKNLFNNWNANNFGGYSIDPSHPQLRGAMFAVWNDMIGAKENGICEFDIYDRSLPATQVIAEKLWSGSTDRTYDKFISIAIATSTIPNVNLTYKVPSKTSTVVSYSFEDSNLQIVTDSSGNNYNAVVNNVTSVVGKLGKAIQLNGGSSYIKTSLDNIGPNYTVTMWVNKNTNGDFSEQILAESSISVLKACQKLTGNIGFSREGVDYSFNYKLPENQWIKLTFVGALQEIKLYINNMLIDTINVQSKGKSGTFVFPLTRIGSLTKAFKGVI
ncbi:MAG: discoidin domain-containing protein, partial [Sarcina sp.]